MWSSICWSIAYKKHPEDKSSGEAASHLHFPFSRFDLELHKDLLYKIHNTFLKLNALYFQMDGENIPKT